MKKKERKDYGLDVLEHISLTPEQIKHHRFTKQLMNRLEISALVCIFLAGITYGVYKCLPEPTQQYLDSQVQYIASYFVTSEINS